MSDPATAVAVSDDIEVESNGTPESPAVAPVLAPQAVAAVEEADETLEARDPGDETPEPAKPPKPRNSIQAKIDQAVARQREAERRADAAEQRLAQSRPPEQKPAEPQPTRSKPSEDEIGTKYKSYPEYVEDLTDWKLEQRDAKQAQVDAQRAQQEQRAAIAQRHEQHATKFSERIAKAEETDPQFWTKIAPEIADLTPSTAYDPADMQKAYDAARQGNPQARAFLGRVGVADAIFDSEYSTELMAHFSANLTEFQRLSTLPPSQLAREMGRLEGSFTRAAAASPGPAPKTPVVSQAPPPIKPVGTTASTAERNPLEEDLDIDEHIRVMNARDKKGRFTR